MEQVAGISDDVWMDTEEIIETLRKKFERVSEVLDERGRRVWAAAEAEALGYVVGKVSWQKPQDSRELRSIEKG